MSDQMIETFPIPGSTRHLTYARDASGRLVRLGSGERVYFENDTWGEGLAHVREVALQNSLLRHVHAAGETWIEEYVWDDAGRPLRVDGVEVERDEQFRVTRCGDWRYGYAGDDLVVVGTPEGLRHVTRGVDGRPVATRNGTGPEPIRYGADDARDDVPPLPDTWTRDELGRLWTIRGADGQVETTFLWDGFRCVGRIDGDAGDPLAAFFSLDPTWTPVRVVTRDGVTRIPRDAFGESLLAHERIPGLFGGAMHGGFMHYRSRALDPRTGSFDRRDPWHGGAGDPRRAEGYDGPLPVESPACGPYAVCQYDPVGRLDPTGEASTGHLVGMGFVYTLLDLTWSLQHNLAGWLGLEWTIAWWSSLLWGIGHALGSSHTQNPMSRFFDYERLYNDRTGVWALRRGFLGVSRPFTYQHTVVSEENAFRELDQANAILPNADFEPSLYGTILRAEPVDAPPVLLRGSRDHALLGWSRSGGAAKAVAPGSPTPRFPRGGLHFDTPLEHTFVPVNCNVAELTPSAPPLEASLLEPALTTFVPYDTDIAVNAVVRLTDGTGAVDIKTISEVDKAHQTRTRGLRIRFAEPGLTVHPIDVTLKLLKAASATDTNRKAVAGTTTHLDIAGTKVEYDTGDLLRFKQGTQVVGAGVIEKFEAKITLDSDPGLAAPLEIRVAVPAGKKTGGKLAGKVLTATPRPDKGDAIVLTGGGDTVAAMVTVEKSDTEVELDRSPAELVGLGIKVDWQGLKEGTEVGVAATAPGAADLTYTPETLGRAPDKGHVFVRSKTSKDKVARSVKARVYDALVTTRNIPGNAANPYDVEVFPTARLEREHLTLGLDPRLKLAAALPAGTKSLQVVDLNAAPPLAAGPIAANATINGNRATLTGGTMRALAPSQFVVVTAGATVEKNVVQRISATLTLDRALPFAAGAVIDVVALGPGSSAYDATSLTATELHVQPTANAGAFATQMPRFVAGAIVQTVFGGNTHQYIIEKVDGTVITVKAGPTGAAIAAGTNGTVQLLVPGAAPAPHPTWRIGRNGKPAGANQITVDIWDTGHFAGNPRVGLVSGNTTHVANVTAAAFEVTLQSASAIAGGTAVTVTAWPGDAFYAGTFVQSGTEVTLLDTHGTAPVHPSGNLFIVVPYAAAADAAKLTDTPMSSGTVLVPADAEKYEVDRRKSLVYHELTHTKQSQIFGPLFMGYFPAFALEGLLELTTDLELPKFSQYAGGAIEQQGSQKFLRITNPQGVVLAEEDHVQITQDNVIRTVALGALVGTRFSIPANNDFVAGPVQLRRQVNETDELKALNVVFNIVNSLTLGAVMNYVTGTIWGGLGVGIAKLVHLLAHRVGKAGDRFPAVVVNAQTVRMTSEDGRRAIQGFDRIYLHKGSDTSDLLDVASIENDVVTLRDSTSFTGDISVRPYGSDDPLFDVGGGLNYFDATVPDPARPAQVRIKKKGDKALELDVFDIVSINAGTSSERTNVTAVNADGTVDLEDSPKTFGTERELRIAKVDEKDPMGNADNALLMRLGLGWMRWLTDPYRQLQFDLDPKPGSASDVMARIGRYSFSSHAWSALIPGHLFLDDLFYQPNRGRLTGMEQQASDESGNTYSALSKIRMGFEKQKKTHAEMRARVGEIAHFWHTPNWFGPGDHPYIEPNRCDLPGVSLRADLLTVLPEVSAETGGVDVNKGATSTNPKGGMFLPDVFYPKAVAGDPDQLTSPHAPNGWMPGGRGVIPPKPGLELSLGSYVAFTRPGKHRVTVVDGIGGGSQAREAHDVKEQTILFDVHVSDVTVEVAGTTVAQATPLPEVTLLPLQKAVVSLSPQKGEWALLPTRPGHAVKADRQALVAERKTGVDDVVELSRVYPTAAGTYTDAVLSTHGVLLPVDVHVPVRQFRVKLIDTFSFVDAAKKGAAVVTTVKAGTKVFAFIPSPIFRVLFAKTFTPALATNPKPKIRNVTPVPADLTAFIGSGRVFEIEFAADDPPEAKVKIDFDAEVGPTAGTFVKGSIEYEPHFVLNAPSFDVKQTKDITLTAPEDLASVSVIAPADGVKATLQPDNRSIKVEASATAKLGSRRILAVSKADATRKAARTIKVIA